MSSTTVTETSEHTKAVEDETSQMLRAAEISHTKPLWKQMSRLNPALPNPRCIPHLWKYSDIQPTLLQAGHLVTESQAERRVLMLVNPSRDAPFTTDTLYAGLQLVMPNETAKAHRHTAFAMRFIIEGNGGFTAVHGKRIAMNRGDVILTPTWNWHDHGKDGSGPMIWLDGLDLPNFTHFPVHFVEHFSSPRYPADDVDTSQSPIVFPWSRMKASLDSEEGQYVTRRYLRTDGSEVSKVLGGCAARLDAGATSPLVQETASSVYHVVEGSGQTRIGDKVLIWKKGDTFCIPSWYSYQHSADEGLGSPVYLYCFDDTPMLKSLGFYRSADMDVETLVSA
ncbi:Putative rmlC-like cupin domain superfamily, rmlC-like jelly roll, gentisate 1,2-dioxygenase [Colletotrichum destructivum]|uniref:RmlC-like cupin domain superfamily, rmlC-like jelly roll, gentisate 1,2-dioxygenase n=1 Tax=Colletotrichum destructivum TaxID=34406 RepID=A0AAX4IU80_9PEZI|nr:Putative rmlC-like cupin domain superfamily, rmlC-like jelly roll, gentisate 1,2-dioxygenase [Colletotrichum destructivum]